MTALDLGEDRRLLIGGQARIGVEVLLHSRHHRVLKPGDRLALGLGNVCGFAVGALLAGAVADAFGITAAI